MESGVPQNFSPYAQDSIGQRQGSTRKEVEAIIEEAPGLSQQTLRSSQGYVGKCKSAHFIHLENYKY